ncbi:MAG: hypothetical protein WCC14_14805, partial [Acidobacteriaceae bacterium]
AHKLAEAGIETSTLQHHLARDAQIFTNDREKLSQALGHDVSHQSAHTPDLKPPQHEIPETPKQEKSQGMDIGLSL